MKPTAGAWVSGDDLFDREIEQDLLAERVANGNHILLTGQRRMGKTTLAHAIGDRFAAEGWVVLFIDIEDATVPEDVIAAIAAAAQHVAGISEPFVQNMGRWLRNNVKEVSSRNFWLAIRSALDAGTWRRHGDQLIGACAANEHRVLIVLDELPIFLVNLLKEKDGADRAEQFLRWLRRLRQQRLSGSPTFLLTGSIGLAPLVGRLGIPDCITDLYSFRLSPWDRDTTIACIERLATDNNLPMDACVPNAVYEALGIGVPHFVQSFFIRLSDFVRMSGESRVTLRDVETVYQTEVLGASGQGDLLHYEKRLQQGLNENCFKIATQILAEAATQGVFSSAACRSLAQRYATVPKDVQSRISEILEVLEHDGYLERTEDGHRIPFRLLKDWLASRYRDHHVSLKDQLPDATGSTQ